MQNCMKWHFWGLLLISLNRQALPGISRKWYQISLMLVLVRSIFPSFRNYVIISAKIESPLVKPPDNWSPGSPAGGWLEKTAIIEALSNRSLASPNNRCFFSKHKEGKSYSAFPSLCDWKDWKRFAFPTFQPHKFTPSAALCTDFPSWKT